MSGLAAYGRPEVTAMITMTYGNMPTREQFDTQFESLCPDGTFAFGNDKRLGTCALDADGLWEALQAANRDYEELLDEMPGRGNDPEIVGSWMSGVLYCLGIEWV